MTSFIVLPWKRKLFFALHAVCHSQLLARNCHILYNTGQCSSNGLRSPEQSHAQGEESMLLYRSIDHICDESD